jgi:hypothetical protein
MGFFKGRSSEPLPAKYSNTRLPPCASFRATYLASYPKLFAAILFSSTIAVTVILAAFACYRRGQSAEFRADDSPSLGRDTTLNEELEEF